MNLYTLRPDGHHKVDSSCSWIALAYWNQIHQSQEVVNLELDTEVLGGDYSPPIEFTLVSAYNFIPTLPKLYGSILISSLFSMVKPMK